MELNKKEKRMFIIGIITLVVLIGGATYAYFQVGTSNLFGTSTINATADNIGNVILTGEEVELSMDLTAVDMMRGNSNINYYATPTGKSTDASDKEHLVATASVSPTTDTNYYHCTYTLEVSQSYSGDKNMYRVFKGLDQVNNETYTPSENELILIVNGTNYDLSLQANNLTKEIEGEFYIKGSQTREITAGLELVNRSDKNQNLLAGSGVNISVGVKSGTFSCTAEEEPQEIVTYYTNEGTYVGSPITAIWNYDMPTHKVSNYQNLNVYRRLDSSTANNNQGTYSVYPESGESTCESDNNGVACESVTQQYFIKETTREVTSNEPIYEVYISKDNGSTYNISDNYTAEELSAVETNELGDTLTCDNETELDLGFNNIKIKCETHASGYTYTKISNEVCSNYGNTLICMKETDWENTATLKSQFETAGLTCKYRDNDNNTWSATTKPTNGYLYCSETDPENGDSVGEFGCGVYSDGGAGCEVCGEGYCEVVAGSAGCVD